MSGLADNLPALSELAPVLRRAVDLDAAALTRLKLTDSTASVFVRLPFGVLVSRTVGVTTPAALDTAVSAARLLAWLDGTAAQPPPPADDQWRSSLPPSTGWKRIDTVPDDVVRNLVRIGAQTLQDTATRDGVPGAQPRAEVADALLDSIVLTVTSDDARVEISLRTLSALTRMGFLTRGSHIAVAVAGRWTRVAAEFGSVFVERAGLGLTMR